MPEITLGPDDTFHLIVDGHTLSLPCNLSGMKALRRILRKRIDAQDKRIGTQASPVQAMVDAWLRNDAEAKADAIAKLTLEELGL
jgi:hypothetical protein